ncbi:VanZ family protein [Sphingobacterium rhinopitheci]|mgnify:CR=1 FL=1|uniref:VanZ family protein n=1 Tax=Sphingobacterium rhinopitheci TaxID=2781960 RepID=UPI001F51C0D5|nr:VanZ family protein [Sphingobacterium rhinopitheci]MCI0921839.1 VanZ family protein [Sphingobacterium rhinopitheci]
MNYFINYIWAILWGAIICLFLLLPSNSYNSIPMFPGIDKMVHLGIFFVQATLLYWEASMKSNRTANKWIIILKVIPTTAVFAVMTELAQMYLTNTRSADPWDVFADIVGVGMATFSFILIYKRVKK